MKSNLDILRQAVSAQLPVSFRYRNPKKPAEPSGLRVGNPHAVYATSAGNVNVDLYQTEGAMLETAVLPAWRDYTLDYMVDVQVLTDRPPFEEAPGYKSYNRKYERKFFKL